jgi:hypothetical protein
MFISLFNLGSFFGWLGSLGIGGQHHVQQGGHGGIWTSLANIGTA